LPWSSKQQARRDADWLEMIALRTMARPPAANLELATARRRDAERIALAALDCDPVTLLVLLRHAGRCATEGLTALRAAGALP
jgi:hypothetical protein